MVIGSECRASTHIPEDRPHGSGERSSILTSCDTLAREREMTRLALRPPSMHVPDVGSIGWVQIEVNPSEGPKAPRYVESVVNELHGIPPKRFGLQFVSSATRRDGRSSAAV